MGWKRLEVGMKRACRFSVLVYSGFKGQSQQRNNPIFPNGTGTYGTLMIEGSGFRGPKNIRIRLAFNLLVFGLRFRGSSAILVASPVSAASWNHVL